MTDNIEKLYELAGMGKKEFTQCCSMGCSKPNEDCYNCEHYEVYKIEYPPFTDTKQLELIKWLATKFILGNFKGIDNGLYNFNLTIASPIQNKHILCEHKEYGQALAGLVCELWENLTDEQKKEVRGILE